MKTWFKNHTPAVVDLVERASATFGQAFLAVVVVNDGTVPQKTALETALAAGGLAVAKFLLVKANSYLKTTATPAK